MASPQAENGHIDIANTIADKFCSYRLSGQEWQIIWVVLRKTWGWLVDKTDKCGPKKKADRIALSQFEDLTGIDRRKCHEILKKLIKKNIIKKTVTQKGDRIVITYGFQKNYDLWKLSPKKVTVTQKGDGVSPKKVTKLSPKKVNTKEKKETITKEKELYSPNFLAFWEKYPRKEKKKTAFTAYKKIQSPKPTLQTVIDSIEAHKKSKQWQDIQYVPLPATFLNARQWEDELEPINGKHPEPSLTPEEQIKEFLS